VTVRILYDGWPLVYEPLGAGAWHIRALLALKPDGFDAVLAMPTEPQASLNPGVRMAFEHTHDQGEWEQRIVPRFAQEAEAHIHTTGLASLFGKARTFASPADGESQRGRLAEAQGRGGLARATTLWPQDLPAPRDKVTILPAAFFPEFANRGGVTNKLNLPDDFLLVHGLQSEASALQLLESWTWAAASIGEFYPLVMVGLNPRLQTFVQSKLPDFHVEGSVRMLDVQPQDLPAIYQASTAIVHLGQPAPWGNPLRHALAAGKALVAHDDPATQAIAGAAGYLIAAKDLRGFGAAMITTVVDEKAREKLEDAAQRQAAHYDAARFQKDLLLAYGG
jgi:hypothetical protein